MWHSTCCNEKASNVNFVEYVVTETLSVACESRASALHVFICVFARIQVHTCIRTCVHACMQRRRVGCWGRWVERLASMTVVISATLDGLRRAQKILIRLFATAFAHHTTAMVLAFRI